MRILTDNAAQSARILDVQADPIKEALEENSIVVVAGFQGVDASGNITTLGRGGSDTSAVAVAAALGADSCEIYTDVDGVYTADPRVVSKARKLKCVTHDVMLEMSSLGAKVLQIRSVEFAAKHNVPVHVRSSFNEEEGTMIVSEDRDMERMLVAGVTFVKTDARITVTKVPDEPGVAAKVFSEVADAGISVDMIIQNTRAGNMTDITFTVPKTAYKEALVIVEKGRQGNRRRIRGRRRQHRQGVRDRRGYEKPSRRGRQDVLHPGCKTHQHHDDLHLRNTHLLRGGGTIRRTGLPSPPHGLWPGRALNQPGHKKRQKGKTRIAGRLPLFIFWARDICFGLRKNNDAGSPPAADPEKRIALAGMTG